MNFKEMLLCAKDGDPAAIGRIAEMYRPLLIKKAILDGFFDEDLYQELWLTLLNCIRAIHI